MNTSARSEDVSPCSTCDALEQLSDRERQRLLSRDASSDGVATTTPSKIREHTAQIVEYVRRRGDDALLELAARFDQVTLEALEVPKAAWSRALDSLDPPLRLALDRAARNIESVHRALLPTEVRWSPEPGVTIGRRPDPLSRVGVYAPGGRAAYPSSLLMGAVPARVASVGEVIVCSPPTASGRPLPIVLAAAHIAGVDRVFSVGGAGAIAAMALGTATIPRVDRIVGPGNAYVAEAKLQLVDRVAIDSPAGPSELLVLADDNADARHIAHEMVAQAEHDPDAAVITIVVGPRAPSVIQSVNEALDQILLLAPREGIAREALKSRGALLSAVAMTDAITFCNDYAAEHLLLCLGNAEQERDVLVSLRNAGTVFLGSGASVAFGDYITGANHVLPTAGLARSWSGLSTLDFIRWTTWQEIDRDAARSFGEDVLLLANAEGLPAHGAAAVYAGGTDR